MIGTTLAHYRITAALGAGGMGEVWRAEDTKLGREVALKVLPEEFARDPERMARFEREAKVLASLNHPNIAHLYGLETVSGTDADSDTDAGTSPKPQASSPTTFLVMELVEGEDLSERISRGAIPVDDAIPIALQIAEALEAAHEQGIVHRDLKPANIKLTEDGAVKVLDFGLAKAWESEETDSSLSLSPTVTRHATAAGVILGTAAYMSPDQARGKKVDRRADIWAFGVVLWEMLTGRKLFEGDTVSDVLASVLKEAPDLDAMPDDTPPAVRRLVARCLKRDPRKRLQWIGDARLDLEEQFDPVPVASITRPDDSIRSSAAVHWVGWVAAAAALALAGFVWLRSSPPTAARSVRLTVGLGNEQSLSFIDERILALSRDGRSLAMTATAVDSGLDMIYVRHFDQADVVPVVGTQGSGEAFFSPDGTSIGFFAQGKLKRVSVAGGSVVNIADTPNPRGGVWLPDGSIVYSPTYADGLWRVAESGSVPEVLLDVDPERGERSFRFPDASQDGKIVVFTVGTLDSPNNYDNATIDALDLESGVRTTVIEHANMARFIDDERLAFSRDGNLFAIAFDPDTMETRGDPVPVVEGVGGDPSSGAGHFSVAAGTLAWVSGAVTSADTVLTIVNADGTTERLPLEPRGFHQPRFSPDGSKVAVTVGVGYSGVEGDVWVYNLAASSINRLTFGGYDLYPAWSPDGSRVAYLSYPSEAFIVEKPADGSGTPTTLTPVGTEPIFPESFSPDGRTLAYTSVDQTSDIYLLARGEEPRLFEKDASCPTFSPDGRWIAYQQPGSGTSSVYVRPVEGNGKWQVSPGLGAYPRWSSDGRRLFYIQIATSKRPLMQVDVAGGDAFEAGTPRVVVESLARFVTATSPAMNWDVAPSGENFIFTEFEREEGAEARVEIIINWAQNLELGTP